MLPGSLDAGYGKLLTSSRATRPGRTAQLANGMTVLFAAMRRAVWQGRSADRRTLAELDDYLLRDIGLTRTDVEQELRTPFRRA